MKQITMLAALILLSFIAESALAQIISPGVRYKACYHNGDFYAKVHERGKCPTYSPVFVPEWAPGDVFFGQSGYWTHEKTSGHSIRGEADHDPGDENCIIDWAIMQ